MLTLKFFLKFVCDLQLFFITNSIKIVNWSIKTSSFHGKFLNIIAAFYSSKAFTNECNCNTVTNILEIQIILVLKNQFKLNST